MKRLSLFKIFFMTHIVFMTILINDAIFRWSGISFYMTFREFLPNLAMMILIFTLMAMLIAVILKLIEILGKSITKRLGIAIGFGMLYAWSFLVVVSVLMVKYLKFWIDSFTSVPYWNIFRFVVLVMILVCASVLTWKLRERLITSITERLKPVFWVFLLISLCSILVAGHHIFQRGGQASPSPARVSHVDSSKPNIILVTFDALSARDMSLNGYERITTPFLEEFVKESHLFTRFHANSNFTTTSLASMLTSKYPWAHQIYHLEGVSEVIRKENLAKVLRENGYTTMAFVANNAVNPLQMDIVKDFDILVPYYKMWFPSRISTSLILIASRELDNYFYITRRWLEFYFHKIFSWGDTANSEFPIHLAFDSFFDQVTTIRKPFFAWIHLMPPHAPYLPPEPHKNTFAGKLEMASSQAQQNFRWGPYPLSQQSEIDSLRKRYDEFILYCDAELKGFVNRLKENRLYDQSLLILSSDHGEMFERGYYTHGGPYLYEPLVHIPMIIHEPGQTHGTQIDTLSEFIDLAPTLLDYIEIPIPKWMEGESFLTVMRGGTPSTRFKFSMWFEKNRSLNHPITTGTVAIFEGDFKLIHYIKENRSELYNLSVDPKEEHDLIDEETQVAQWLKSTILERIQQINATRMESRKRKNEPAITNEK